MGYSSDLSDAGWAFLEPFVTRTTLRGKPDKYDKRLILNALLYWVKTGCQWRMIPEDFGVPWFVVYDYYRRWNARGVWETVLCKLIEASRVKSGRAPTPSYGIVDSQSVKTAYHGAQRGIDGGKKNQRAQTAHRC
jgi:putative transposase